MPVRQDQRFAYGRMARVLHWSSNDFLSAGALGVPVSAAPFAWSCWVRIRSGGRNSAFIGIADSGATGDWWSLGIDSSDFFRHQARDNATNSIAVSTVAVDTSLWYHLLGAEQSASSRYVAVNGIVMGTNAVARSPDTCDRFSIGRVSDQTPSLYSDIVIKDVAVWNARFSQEDAWFAYRAGSPLNFRKHRRSLVSYLPLDQPRRGADIDVVGKWNMTAFNSPTWSRESKKIRGIWQMPRIVTLGGSAGAAPGGGSVPVMMRSYRNMRT